MSTGVLEHISPSDVQGASDEEFRTLAAKILEVAALDRKENALHYYVPVSKHALETHRSVAQTVGIGGGNGSSKTETMMAELLCAATGIIPDSLKNEPAMRQKQRGPINCRITVESIINTLYPIILPKLQWWKWTGVDEHGGKRGHWGWIPRAALIEGDWAKSWSDKLRILRLRYHDPDTGEYKGESTIQFMSFDQDASDFASGDFHICAHDEPPNHSIWRENQARTMRVGGRMFLAMTWPDDPSIPVDWLFDEVYEPGSPGPNKRKDIDWFNFFTTDNPNLNQEAVSLQAEKWSPEVKSVRLFGQPIRFSHRVHPLFTDQTQTWCFECQKSTISYDGKCGACGSIDLAEYNHVVEEVPSPAWPTVYIIDPHPRKPHMMTWAQLDPHDDYHFVTDRLIEGDPHDVKEAVQKVEEEFGLFVAARIMDPNMGASPAGARRGITWQDEFAHAGLTIDLADDSEVGRKRIDDLLRPDPHTRKPRMTWSTRCESSIQQYKRYIWDDFKKTLDKDQKQKPKTRNDDFPTMGKYLVNAEFTFRFLRNGPQWIRRRDRQHSEPKRGEGIVWR